MQFHPLQGAAKLRDAGSSRSLVRKVLGAFLLALFCGTVVRAGEDPLLPIQLGKILFYPSASFSYALEDNVERSNGDNPLTPVIASSVQDIRPTLRFEAPFQRSTTTLAYSAKFRDYGAKELKNASGTSQYLDFTELYKITPSLRLNLQDNFLDGITELQEIDPGGELRFGTQPFRSNSAQAVLSLEMGPIQSVEVGGNLLNTRFDAISESQPAFESRSEGLGTRYLLAIGPDNRLFVAADWQYDSQDRGTRQIEPADYRTRSVGLGFRRDAGPVLSSELRVSYAVVDFPDDPGKHFQGITAEGNLGRPLGVTAQVTLMLYRGPRTSFFNVNSFYLNEMMEIGYSQEIGQRFRVQLTGGFQHNSYPEPVDSSLESYLSPSEGTRRRDDLRGGAARLIYHVGRAMDLRLEYRRDRARSNIVAESLGVPYKIFDYDYESVTTSLIVGWQ
jgi:hypothetical protein